ncbi:hemerythrin domain-containing protein [Streptomyces sp. NBC_01317]|uniref:hemerythrin domain-containing protein n=1 Tax=Streptomyces sp. NBC_01317 TaxID=2903822 RepID=UPI002E13B42D|nr:hemerythrin domain-containing protein [Streptomyces sp. NBC_01317]
MAASPQAGAEGSKMYDELLAVHMIMRRGAALVTASFARLTAGEDVDVRALVKTSRWLIEFVHHHHASEDELFWPVLRGLFPASIAVLDSLTVEHEALDTELHTLARAVDGIADPDVTGERAKTLAVVGRAALAGLPSAQKVQDLLATHLDREEPVLRDLFPQVPDADIIRVREAIVHGAPRHSPYLVFGLMEDPVRVPGYEAMAANFPAPLRRLRPLLLTRYRTTKKSLGATR